MRSLSGFWPSCYRARFYRSVHGIIVLLLGNSCLVYLWSLFVSASTVSSLAFTSFGPAERMGKMSKILRAPRRGEFAFFVGSAYRQKEKRGTVGWSLPCPKELA